MVKFIKRFIAGFTLFVSILLFFFTWFIMNRFMGIEMSWGLVWSYFGG